MKYIFLLLFLSSCASVYQPATIVDPGFKEKGDITAVAGIDIYNNASGSLGRPEPGFFTYGAFSPLNHLYLGGSFSTNAHYNEGSAWSKHNRSSVFTGYYKKIGEEFASVDILGGIGMGKGREYYQNSGTKDQYQNGLIVYGSYKNFFLQPGFHFQVSILKFDFSCRINYLHYTQNDFYHINWVNQQTYLYPQWMPANLIYVEPSGTCKIKTGPLNFFVQLAFSNPPGLKNSPLPIDNIGYAPFLNISAGIALSLTGEYNILKGNKDNNNAPAHK